MRKVRFNAVTAKNITTGAERDIPAIKGKDGAPGVKGDPGADGAPGPQGIPGQEGQPGFSPEVTIFEITGGHRVTITDAEGDHSFDVMDGQGSIDDVSYAFIAERLYNNTTNLTDEQKLKIETWLGLSENYLTAYNETPYQVTGDYNPAHKKYVDGLVNELQLFKFPNATIIGEPTINNGQISGFSATSYLKFPFLVDFNSRPFEINMEFTTGSNVTSQENIFDSDFGLAFAVRNSRFVIAVSTNGTSWNLGEGVGTYTVLANTTYRVKLWWDRMTYHLSYSVNGGSTYTEDITKVGAFQPAPKQMYIGVGETFATVNNHFTGIINMNHCNLSINGQLIWQGMDDAGLATRLEIDMSNIDADGIAYINGLINKAPSIVRSVNNIAPDENGNVDVQSGGSSVVIEDNPDGGVDLTVDDNTVTLAKQEMIENHETGYYKDGNAIPGGWLDAVGTVIEDPNCCYSDFIPFVGGHRVTCYYGQPEGHSLYALEYDAAYVRRNNWGSSTPSRTFNTGSTTAYLKCGFSIPAVEAGQCYIKDETTGEIIYRPRIAKRVYGLNELANDFQNTVQYKPQTLTPEEKVQAVTNIGLNNVETLVLEPEYREIKVLTEEDYNALTAYVDSKVSGLNAIIGSGVIE